MPQVPSELHLAVCGSLPERCVPGSQHCRDYGLRSQYTLQAKALVWQEQVEVLTQALQQANAEKAVLAADKGRLEQEVANLRLQLSVIQKAMEAGQLPVSAPLPMPAQPALVQPVSPVHPMVQQVHHFSFVPACSPMNILAMPQC